MTLTIQCTANVLGTPGAPSWGVGAAGVVFIAIGPTGVQSTATTSASGWCAVPVASAGVYTVVATPPPGMSVTAQGTQSVTVPPADSAAVWAQRVYLRGDVAETSTLLPGAGLTLSLNFGSMPPVRQTPPPWPMQPAGGLNDPAFQVAIGYPFEPAWSNINAELGVYPSGPTIAANPSLGDLVTVRNGCLALSARPATAAERVLYAAQWPAATHVCGAINTQPYAQKYGLFEMSALLPKGQGLWPAFWLLPSSTPATGKGFELDIIEVLCGAPTTLYQTTHDGDGAAADNRQQVTNGPDLSADFHIFSLLWGPDTLTFYLDRVATMTMPTPADAHAPAYILANLAVGGSWGGPPNASTAFPAAMIIDWIKVWQLPAWAVL